LPVMRSVRTTASILRTQLPASVASCQRSFRVGAAGPRPSWQTASWRPPKHTGGRARTCDAGAPRVGPTALALHCRIGSTTYNCYWESAEKNLQREAGTREGAPRGPPGIGAGIGGRPEPSSPIEQGPDEPPPVTDVGRVHCLLQRPLPGRTARAGAREEGPPGSRYWAISRRAGP
jgi:hypothetical protein